MLISLVRKKTPRSAEHSAPTVFGFSVLKAAYCLAFHFSMGGNSPAYLLSEDSVSDETRMLIGERLGAAPVTRPPW